MRLDRFEVGAFGRLANLKAEGLAGHPLLVFVGGNESGKTTFARFFEAMLYGFSPHEREANPWAPWVDGAPPAPPEDGSGLRPVRATGALAGRASFLMTDGRTLQVSRRQADRPEGRLTLGGQHSDLGNRPLPCLGPVHRELWNRFHMLSREELAELDDDGWRVVQERLLSGAHVPWLKTAREALLEIDRKAAALWRNAPRGRTRARRIALELRKLRKERDAAAARQRRLLALREELAAKQWHAQGVEEQLRETEARLRRAERLLPVLRAMQEIEELRRRSKAALPNDDFPADARADLAERRADVRRLGEEADALSAEIAGHERRVTISLSDNAILAVEKDIRELVAENAVHHQDLVHSTDLDRSRDAQEALFRERGTNVFRAALDAAQREALGRLGMAELQGRIKGWEEAARGPEAAREELRVAKENVKACELDFEAVPSLDGERRLRAREEGIRQLQAREDVLATLKKDIEAAKAAAAAGRKGAADKAAARHKQRAALLCAGGAALGGSLALGAMPAVFVIGPVAAGLLVAGVRAFRAKAEVVGTPDEQRAEALRQECQRLRQGLDLHEFETVAQHLEKAQQALAHVAARPELERRLIAARQRVEDCSKRVGQREAEATRARGRVGEFLASFPMLEARLEQPGQDLFNDLEDLRAFLREMTRLSGEREAVQQRARAREARAAELALRLEVVLPGPAMDAAPLWHEKLQLALAARRRGEESTRVLPELRERARELEGRLSAEKKAFEAASRRLCSLAGKDGRPEDGLGLLDEARRQLREASELEAELHRVHPDWKERGEEAAAAVAAGEELDLTTDQRVGLGRMLEQLREELARLGGEVETLRRERGELSAHRGLADVDGEIGALKRDLSSAWLEHDRLALLANLVRAAEQAWREKHESPVLAGAGHHLSALTGNRWTRLSVERDGLRPKVWVQPGNGGHALPAEAPLSRALLEQVWFSLRLSLAEQLDGDEPLPLVLDDVLSDWDAERRSAALARLLEVGTCRQVLLLTGQVSVANQFRDKGRAHLIELPAVPAVPAAKTQASGGRPAPAPAPAQPPVARGPAAPVKHPGGSPRPQP